MHTVKIKSEMFSNVVFVKYDNGYHIELEKETNVFEAGKAYSESELFKSGSYLANVLQFEAFKLAGWNTPESMILGFILDSKYSLKAWNNSLKWLEDVSTVFDVKKYNVHTNREDEFFTSVYGMNEKQALQMFKNYCKLVHIDSKDYQLKEVDTVKKENFKSDHLVKDVFYIPDHGKESTPFDELDYFKWLTINKVNDHHSIKTRKQYLDFLGYDSKTHRLLEEDLTLLKYTLQYHFDSKLNK